MAYYGIHILLENVILEFVIRNIVLDEHMIGSTTLLGLSLMSISDLEIDYTTLMSVMSLFSISLSLKI